MYDKCGKERQLHELCVRTIHGAHDATVSVHTDELTRQSTHEGEDIPTVLTRATQVEDALHAFSTAFNIDFRLQRVYGDWSE